MPRIELGVVLLAAIACAPNAAYPPSPIDLPPATAGYPPPSPPPSPRADVAPSPAAKPVDPPATPSGPDPLMPQLLAGGTALKAVMAAPEKYRFEVLYGVITEGASPMLERHAFRADAEYFFPASEMKVPIALALYDRLAVARDAGRSWLTRDATLRIHPLSGTGDPWVTTLARETWRALIVSDNASANRLLGFVGHREAHESLWSLGFASARIRTGFAIGVDLDPANQSPRIEVVVQNATQEIAARTSNLVLPPTDAKGLAIGTAQIVDGRRIEGPMSFAEKNAIHLRELQDALVRIMRPELLVGAPTDMIAKEDLEYLRQSLGTLPSQSGLAGYDRNVVLDYQLSPFLRGIERVRPRGRFQIFSKVGQAYGFLVANAYVVDKDTGRAFFLIATVYANPNEVMNDDLYAYDSIAFPVLADVGEACARHAFTR